jgi:PhzF family phenazine biosynthesis protein
MGGSMSNRPIFLAHVDSFTKKPFAGNPAGVCILPDAKPVAWMQAIAREMSLSETAFLVEDKAGWQLRWFTPSTEVDLCGHGTLASAHILWEVGLIELDMPIRFFTKSGELAARRDGDWIELDFPADPELPQDVDPGLADALGAQIVHLANGKFDLLAELESEAVVRALKPNMEKLARLPGRGVIVTARAEPGSGFDFVSRYFGPALGIPEDPATGSAHCALAPYWAKRLGKTQMVGYQCSARGGVVRVRWTDDRVLLGGQAVTVAVGEVASAAE